MIDQLQPEPPVVKSKLNLLDLIIVLNQDKQLALELENICLQVKDLLNDFRETDLIPEELLKSYSADMILYSNLFLTKLF